MPMARTRAGALGLEGRVFANLPRSGGGDTLEAQLAADGVSCTVCHQISDERLGTPESFGGGFVMAAPADGNVVGSLPEQVPYQEWQHSAFVAEEVGCQSCHMPAVGTRRRSRRAKKRIRDGVRPASVSLCPT